MTEHGELPTSVRMEAARQTRLRRERFRLRMRVAGGLFALSTIVSFLAMLGQPGVG